jgi:hypothetical protein
MDSPAVRACSYEWRSWQWQVDNVEEAASWEPGIRAFESRDEDTLPAIASWCAWYQIDFATLVKYAGVLKIELEAGATLFAVVWALVEGTLKLAPAKTLEIVQNRLARLADNNAIDEIFMEIDEAAELIEHIDAKEVMQHKETIKSKMGKASSFAEDYRKKAKDVLDPHGKTKPPKQKDLAAHLTQAEAKKALPPKCSLWLATRGEWNGHCKPYKRVTAPFHKHGGSHEALRFCLKMLWQQHLLLLGRGKEYCPHKGLL